MQERSVKRAIRELAESDWWQVAGRSGAGRGHTNQYRPHFEKGDNSDTFSGYEMVTGSSPFDGIKGDKLGQKKVSNLSPKPRKNQEEDSMSVDRAAMNPESEAIFEEVWRTLPKRDGANPKKPARLEFERAMKRGADPRAILRGAHNYRLQIDHQAPDDRRFIPQITTWLKQERYRARSRGRTARFPKMRVGQKEGPGEPGQAVREPLAYHTCAV